MDKSNADLVRSLDAIRNAIIADTSSPDDYSTSEVYTGATWVNGNPIYKKTVSIGTLPNNTTKNVAHGVSGLGDVLNFHGHAVSGSARLPLPYISPGGITFAVGVLFDNTNISIVTGADRTGYSGYVTIYYTKV